MSKKFCGHRPGQEWEEAGSIGEMFGAQWSVFVRDADPTGRYLGVKLVACGYVEAKANYWLVWNRIKPRLSSRGEDAKRLKQHRPALYRAVVEVLRGS